MEDMDNIIDLEMGETEETEETEDETEETEDETEEAEDETEETEDETEHAEEKSGKKANERDSLKSALAFSVFLNIFLGVIVIIMISGDHTNVTVDDRKTENHNNTVSDSEMDVATVPESLIRLIYAEAGNESEEVQVAIASVVKNRTERPDEFSATVDGVVFQPFQFTSVVMDDIILNGQKLQIDDIPLDSRQKIMDAIKKAFNGYDPTEGSCFYSKQELFADEALEKLKADPENNKFIDGYVFRVHLG